MLLPRRLPVCSSHEIPSLQGYTCKTERGWSTYRDHPKYMLPLSATASPLPCGSVVGAHPLSSPLAQALGVSLTARPQPSLPEGGGRSVMGLCVLCPGLQERQGGRLGTRGTVTLQGQAGCLCPSIQGIRYGTLSWSSDLRPGSRTCDATVSPLEAGVQRGCLLSRLPRRGEGVAGGARDGDRDTPLGIQLLVGTLPTLVALSPVPSVPLGFQLGVLLVQLQAKIRVSQLRGRAQTPKHTLSPALYTHWFQLSHWYPSHSRQGTQSCLPSPHTPLAGTAPHCSPHACRVHGDSSQWRHTPTGSCSAADPPRRCFLSSRSLHQHCHGTNKWHLLPRCPPAPTSSSPL